LDGGRSIWAVADILFPLSSRPMPGGLIDPKGRRWSRAIVPQRNTLLINVGR
jgi:hypothetical protein